MAATTIRSTPSWSNGESLIARRICRTASSWTDAGVGASSVTGERYPALAGSGAGASSGGGRRRSCSHPGLVDVTDPGLDVAEIQPLTVEHEQVRAHARR